MRYNGLSKDNTASLTYSIRIHTVISSSSSRDPLKLKAEIGKKLPDLCVEIGFLHISEVILCCQGQVLLHFTPNRRHLDFFATRAPFCFESEPFGICKWCRIYPRRVRDHFGLTSGRFGNDRQTKMAACVTKTSAMKMKLSIDLPKV